MTTLVFARNHESYLEFMRLLHNETEDTSIRYVYIGRVSHDLEGWHNVGIIKLKNWQDNPSYVDKLGLIRDILNIIL